MKEGIHPKYEDISATCSCGNVIRPVLPSVTICSLTCVHSVTRFTLASKKLWTPVGVSTSSRNALVAASQAKKTDAVAELKKAPEGAFFVGNTLQLTHFG